MYKRYGSPCTYAAMREEQSKGVHAVWMHVSWYRHPDALDAMRWGPQLRQCASGMDGIAFGLGSSPRRRPSCVPIVSYHARRRRKVENSPQQKDGVARCCWVEVGKMWKLGVVVIPSRLL